ncbi:hypothetical protein [Halosimplex halobium]|uniref:hypothetical protein n=1 Tax=Halosimplex halobium TaxID=3396618 RepID=UPI003F57AC05
MPRARISRLSDRERAEGFHRSLSSAVGTTASERAEGFHRSLSSAVGTTASERAEGFQRLLSSAVETTASERAEGFQRLLSSAVEAERVRQSLPALFDSATADESTSTEDARGGI